MDVNSQISAVMLLTVSFGKSSDSREAPLSNKEWGRLAAWLSDQGVEPAALLGGNVRDLLAGWVDRTVTVPRIESLLGRGGAVALTLERWQRAGLWVITDVDPEYPQRLKRRLGPESPPLLFGCGKRMLLEQGGLAVVGSRNAREEDLSFAERLGAKAAEQGFSIVSGGARGVDQRAMFGALQGEGTVVGVLADSLLRAATSAQYRKFLMSGDLVLVSPYNPELGFDVGKAMSRNRYVYCLGDAAVVISSAAGKGGTWNGAIEGVKADWVPVWVKQSARSASGNADIVARGAHWLPETLESIEPLFASPMAASPEGEHPTAPSLFADDMVLPGVKQMQLSATHSPEPGSEETATAAESREGRHVSLGIQGQSDLDLYDLFLVRFATMTTSAPLPSAQIAENLNLVKTQVDAWLKRGVAEGVIKRIKNPVRYQFRGAVETQASMTELADL